jgi:membrane fusion protein (multidrug efflux system)
MAIFERTLGALSADAATVRPASLAVAGLVLAGWIVWSAVSRVSLYEVTPAARVEVIGAAAEVDSPFLGRVVHSSLHIGRAVHRGEVLVVLDARAELLQQREAQSRLEGIDPQISRLQAQIVAERAAGVAEQRAARLAKQEAEAGVRQAQIAAEEAERDGARQHTLYAQRLVAQRTLQASDDAAHRLAAARDAAQEGVQRAVQEQAVRDREREVRIERLLGEIASLTAERAGLQARIDALGYEIERRRICAPIDGYVADARDLQEGAVVDEGARLGSVVPGRATLRIVAQYPSRAALGRIHAGQPATFRLDGFPWTEYGSVRAQVSHVAQEVRDGTVRVELTLRADGSFRGALQHGMPGTVEILVERISPLALLTRTAGDWLTVPR